MGLAIKNEDYILQCYVNCDGFPIINMESDNQFGGVFVFDNLDDLKSFRSIIDSVIKDFGDE